MRDDSIPMSRWSRSPSTWRNTAPGPRNRTRSEEHTSELQSQSNLVCRLLLEKKKEAVQEDFIRWVAEERSRLPLGNTHLTELPHGVTIYQMVAQHGYWPTPNHRIRDVNLSTY